jgi:hypothetical protein
MRLGIELSAAACRLVELDGRRVRSFAVLPPSGSETDAMFASLKGREAAVVVWRTPAEHRQVVVTAGSYESMRREAIAALTSVGVKTNASLADIAPVPGARDKRRPVVVAVAETEPLLDAVRPIIAAGVRIRSVATPPMALASLAHTRRGVDAADGIEAYIAVEEAATCIALLRDGALAIARELPWGYVADGVLRPRDDIAERLALELEQYLDAVGAPRASQVCVCGGVPELRTMSALLTARLDVEVEPLDSLFGVDESRLPEPSVDFRERIAELRLAWAIAADWPARLNLLRAERRERSRRVLAAVAVAAGVAAGVAGAWRIARTDRFAVSAPTQRVAVPAKPPASASKAPVAPAATAATPPAMPKAAPTSAPLPLLTARAAVPRVAQLARLVRPPETLLTPALIAQARQPASALPSDITAKPAAPGAQVAKTAPVAVESPAKSAPPRASDLASVPAPTVSRPVPPPPAVLARRPESQKPPSERPIAPPPPVIQRPAKAPEAPAPKASEALEAPEAPKAAKTRPPKPEPVLPFAASLETILYSSDRQLAIIDGRIVAVGDLVKGSRIVEISATAVMLRDAQGRLYRLALGAAAK